MAKSFKDIIAWQKAHQLTLEVYKIKYPREEVYGIQSQIRRSTVSIGNNIAEGSGRNTSKELIQYLIISRGSLEETRYLLLLSKDLKYLDNSTYNHLEQLATETSKVLNGLIKSLM